MGKQKPKKKRKHGRIWKWLRMKMLDWFEGYPKERELQYVNIYAKKEEVLVKPFIISDEELTLTDEDSMMVYIRKEAADSIGQALMERGFIQFEIRERRDPSAPFRWKEVRARFRFGRLMDENYRDY